MFAYTMVYVLNFVCGNFNCRKTTQQFFFENKCNFCISFCKPAGNNNVFCFGGTKRSNDNRYVLCVLAVCIPYCFLFLFAITCKMDKKYFHKFKTYKSNNFCCRIMLWAYYSFLLRYWHF